MHTCETCLRYSSVSNLKSITMPTISINKGVHDAKELAQGMQDDASRTSNDAFIDLQDVVHYGGVASLAIKGPSLNRYLGGL